jgi:iron complex outermembrane recepter protein
MRVTRFTYFSATQLRSSGERFQPFCARSAGVCHIQVGAIRLLLAAIACTTYIASAQTIQRVDGGSESAQPEPLPSATPEQDASSAAVPQTLNAVTVTGTKRRQAEQEATQSLTVLKPADFAAEQDAFDALTRVPNLTPSSRSGLPVVRGVDGNGVAFGGGGAVSGGRPRFSTYVDGVARSYSYAPDGNLTLWDVKQLEVYRGAQSTTLGRNSGAGALVVTTNDPVQEDQAALLAGLRNQRNTWNAAAMVNRALTDDLAVRFSTEGTHGKTWRNPVGEEFGSQPLSEPERQDFERYRLKALWSPGALPGLTLRFAHDRQRDAQPNTVDTIVGENLSARRIDAVNYSFFARTNTTTSLQGTLELGNGWSVETVIGRQRAETLGIPPVSGSATFLDIFARTTETSVEPKLGYTAAGSRTSAVIGAFWLKRDRNEGGAPGSAFPYSAVDTSKARSLYADARIEFAPGWDVLLGLRAERETQQRDFVSPVGLALNFDRSTNKVLPKLGAEYRFNPDAALGLVAYRGYQAGGGGVSFRSFTPYLFEPESSTTTEITWRSQWLARRVTVNANLFSTRFKGYQLSGIGPGGPEDTIFLNADRVTSRGAELSLTWQATEALDVSAQLGVLRARIDRFDEGANSAVNGNRLPYAPRTTARFGARWRPFAGLALNGSVYASDELFGNYQNTDDVRVPGYTLIDLSASWRYQAATITAFINNVADRFYLYSRQASFGGFGQAGPPRTVGGSIRMDF